MTNENDIQRDSLRKVCSVLNQYHVDYIIVGGIATGYHGFQRISGIVDSRPELKVDLDFWYKPTLSNFANLTAALGVDKNSLDAIIFNPEKTFLKIPHGTFHTDFLPTMVGLDSYSESKVNAAKETIDKNPIFILSYSDLIKNKELINRLMDREDVKELKKRKDQE
jgi:hypothetical protein